MATEEEEKVQVTCTFNVKIKELQWLLQKKQDAHRRPAVGRGGRLNLKSEGEAGRLHLKHQRESGGAPDTATSVATQATTTQALHRGNLVPEQLYGGRMTRSTKSGSWSAPSPPSKSGLYVYGGIALFPIS